MVTCIGAVHTEPQVRIAKPGYLNDHTSMLFISRGLKSAIGAAVLERHLDTHEPLRACVHAADLRNNASETSWVQRPKKTQVLTSVEMWVTRAELGRFVRALPVRLTPRLYIELMSAARANMPVVMERQKNWGERNECRCCIKDTADQPGVCKRWPSL